MTRLYLAALVALMVAVLAAPAFCDDAKFQLASDTGHMLRGTLYKQSGISRQGVITIRTSSNILRSAPVYRYDFDILYGTIDGNLYTFLMADIAEIDMLPPEDAGMPVNILLRNGVIHKIFLSTESKGILGYNSLSIKEADVVTESYGENIVSGGDISKIVFDAPLSTRTEDMPGLVDEFEKALEVGKRDGLLDHNFHTILDNIQKRMKAKQIHGPEKDTEH